MELGTSAAIIVGLVESNFTILHRTIDIGSSPVVIGSILGDFTVAANASGIDADATATGSCRVIVDIAFFNDTVLLDIDTGTILFCPVLDFKSTDNGQVLEVFALIQDPAGIVTIQNGFVVIGIRFGEGGIPAAGELHAVPHFKLALEGHASLHTDDGADGSAIQRSLEVFSGLDVDDGGVTRILRARGRISRICRFIVCLLFAGVLATGHGHCRSGERQQHH